MTEAEWLTCTEPWKMLYLLPGKVGGRKSRLFACAWALTQEPEGGSWVSAAELYADGLTDPPKWPSFGESLLARCVAYMDVFDTLTVLKEAAPDAWAAAAVLIREVTGNPFRPVTFDPRWRTSDVVGLAQAIYDDKAFERMPILSDALMDAGCEDEQLIGHCRGDSPHVRGC